MVSDKLKGTSDNCFVFNLLQVEQVSPALHPLPLELCSHCSAWCFVWNSCVAAWCFGLFYRSGCLWWRSCNSKWGGRDWEMSATRCCILLILLTLPYPLVPHTCHCTLVCSFCTLFLTLPPFPVLSFSLTSTAKKTQIMWWANIQPVLLKCHESFSHFFYSPVCLYEIMWSQFTHPLILSLGNFLGHIKTAVIASKRWKNCLSVRPNRWIDLVVSCIL